MENSKSLRSLGHTGIMVTPSQIALNWLIHYHGDTVVAIQDATKDNLVKENCGAMSFRLSGEDMTRLDHASSIFK